MRGNLGAFKLMTTIIRLIEKPEPMRSIGDAAKCQSKALKAPHPKSGCLTTKLCGGGTATGRWTKPSPRIPKTMSEELSSMTCCPNGSTPPNNP